MRRADRAALIALVGGGALLAASRYNDLLGLTGDNAVYLLLARNLSSGRAYDNAGFPWGYPALLTPGVAFFGPENLIGAVPWLKLITIAGFLLGLVLLYLLFRLRHDPLPAAAAVALFAVCDLTLIYSNDLMTELPYTAATAAALLFFYRRVQPPAEEGWSRADEQALGTSWRDLLPAALLLVLPYYLRTVGLALLAAAPLALALRRRWREAVMLALGAAVLAAPWGVFSLLTDPDRNYTASLLLRDPYQPDLGKIADASEFVGRLVQAAQFYATQVWPLILFPGLGGFWQGLLGPIFLAAVVGGFLLRLFRRVEATELYVAGFVFILLAWPWRGDRFLLPALPFLFHYMFETVVWLGRQVARLWGRVGTGSRELGAGSAATSVVDARRGMALIAVPVRAGGALARAVVLDKPAVAAPGRKRAAVTTPGSRRAIVLIGALLLALALPNLLVDVRATVLNARYWSGDQTASGIEPEWRMYFDASRWVGEHSPSGSVVLSRKSSLTELYAGRPSELIPLIAPAAFPAWLRAHNVTYIIEDAFTGSIHTTQHLSPALKQFPQMFKLLYSTDAPVNRVWQVLP